MHLLHFTYETGFSEAIPLTCYYLYTDDVLDYKPMEINKDNYQLVLKSFLEHPDNLVISNVDDHEDELVRYYSFPKEVIPKNKAPDSLSGDIKLYAWVAELSMLHYYSYMQHTTDHWDADIEHPFKGKPTLTDYNLYTERPFIKALQLAYPEQWKESETKGDEAFKHFYQLMKELTNTKEE